MSHGWYSIRQVSELSGLSTYVIRKWEERYHTLHPRRLENGYRVYTKDDLSMLLSIKSLVDQGYSVKNAMLSLKQAEASGPAIHKVRYEDGYQVPTVVEALVQDNPLNQLLAHGQDCDDQAMMNILHEEYQKHGIIFLLEQIVTPFLQQIGEYWSTGRWSEHQEHIASLAIRDYLLQLRGTFKERRHCPLLLGTCLPGERHEIPLHILLLYAMIYGWRTAALGPSPAPGALERAVEQLHPMKVIMSASTLIAFEQDPALIDKLEQLARRNPDIDFYLGGTGAWLATENRRLDYVNVTRNVDELFKKRP